MNSGLIIGNKIIRLDKVDSTNKYLRDLKNNENVLEGLIVVTEEQHKGIGQRGNVWLSEKGKNLTLSVLIQPKTPINNQFIISKLISLAVLDLLVEMGLGDVKIKWPNDIYVRDKKIAGILIENTIKNNLITDSIIGIGLNVNQVDFNIELQNPTSIKSEFPEQNFELDYVLKKLLSCIDKRYLEFKIGKIALLNEEYIHNMYGYGDTKEFLINNEKASATIIGISPTGRLILMFENGIEKDFDFKELQFLI